MSLPYVDDEIENEEEKESTVENFEIEGSDLSFDFEAGDIVFNDGDAELKDGEDALAQWIEKALRTRAHVYEIYDTGEDDDSEEEYDDEIEDVYGSQLADIMQENGIKRALKLAMIQRNIESVLAAHPDISAVSSFGFEQTGRTLIVSFVVNSDYGEKKTEVVLGGTDIERGDS